jgi:hypothetical protein
MAEKRIADRRIYGVDPRNGREVLIALPGHPLPDWYVEPGEAPLAPPPVGPVKVERIPKRGATRKAKPSRRT